MRRARRSALAAGLAALLAVAGCTAPARTPEPSVRLFGLSTVIQLEACPWIGGCIGYVSLAPKDTAPSTEARIDDLAVGPPRGVPSFPTAIRQGIWTIRARSVTLADVVEPGQAGPTEMPIGSCQEDIDAQARGGVGTGASVTVLFTSGGCRITVLYEEADVTGPGTSGDQPPSSAPSVAASPTADAGVVVTVLVAGSERYRIRLTHQDDIEIARRLLAGEEAPGIPNGRLMRGVTDVNVGHAWSIDPDDVEFADSTIELCDGLPSQIDRGEFSVDRYCPWSAKVVAIDPAP